MATRKVELFLAPAAAKSRVVIDGEEVKNCRAVTVNARVGELTTVTLELMNVEVTIHADADVQKKVVDITDLSAGNRYYKVVPDTGELEPVA